MTEPATDLVEQYCRDLAPFADLGTDAPIAVELKGAVSIGFFRHGLATEVVLAHASSRVEERFDDQVVQHASFRALLASERYGDLRTWASRQKAFLEEVDTDNLIDFNGSLNDGLDRQGVLEIDKYLSGPTELGATRVMLIDGPAGIGKTQFILSLSKRRAERYGEDRLPLLLHVQSRGRSLSYLYDLMAFSLQRIRVAVTFDQVPVLAKHGLITIAIDGFDELADPEGYGMAWSQVSELVSFVRGGGTIILSGRETFIGRDRLIKDVASIRPEVDDISVLTLNPPTKANALDWLQARGWGDEKLSAIEGFLEPSSLALRPFFLKTLADESIAERIESTSSTNIISILINAMIDREISKFGEAVERELTEDERRLYVSELMSGVARDMADNATVSVSDGTLMLLSDLALPKEIGDSANRILRSRAQVMAFLTNDDRPGYRRFYHDKFYEYFLALVVCEGVSSRSVIKPIARNIFASSFLETFGSLISGSFSVEVARRFLEGARSILGSYVSIDRARRNISALMIASLSVADLLDSFVLDNVEVDEVRFSGTAASALLKNVVISQFDCRGADLSAVQFSGCTILTVIGDGATKLPESFPVPVRVQDVSSARSGISSPEGVREWMDRQSSRPKVVEVGLISTALRNSEHIRLLERACRMRQYWLRQQDDVYAEKILGHPAWPTLEGLLLRNNLLRVESRQASGSDAKFVHIRKTWDILSENDGDQDVVNFYRELAAELS